MPPTKNAKGDSKSLVLAPHVAAVVDVKAAFILCAIGSGRKPAKLKES
ncbi:hypothetical protein BRCON_1696 [Candidatus Sumerlaea chitinivorans]|uniref:Uncharacterized protein n=1 Tax=Sumerlaea chitinivorans TaxID=2250252 RepID=A0A2Z4Y7R8_SUMC1|nr:hypothetical protein BRCON_1696 [Candidatus Sumerlaea chitinivorans]